MSSIEERLRKANPVVDPDSAMDQATYATVLQAERRATAEQEHRLRRRKGRQTLQVAATLLVLTAFLIGTTWRGTRPERVVAGEPFEVSVARSYVDARNSYNTAVAGELLDPGASVVEYPILRSAAELPDLFLFLELVGERLTIDRCDLIQRTPGTVSCSYQLTNRLTAQAAVDGIAGSILFEIGQGRIISIENSVDFDRYGTEVLPPWLDWLNTGTGPGSIATHRFAFHGRQAVQTPRLDQLPILEREINRYAPEGG